MSGRSLTRRLFVAAGAATGAVLGLLRAARTPSAPLPSADTPEPAAAGGYQFLTAAEAAFIEAAVARLIPKDELGPGGIEAGVPIFIDRQLAGDFGQGAHFYLQAPYMQGEKTQGWQMPAPAQVYRAAIAQINRYTMDSYGKTFAELSEEQRDTALKAMESGTVQLKGNVPADGFFELLLQNSIEGFFADPLYGGNRDMVGWKLIGFPGARYDLRDFVARHGEPYPLPPVGLRGRPEWNRRRR
jgi:gluconate 2-dehydrogenase gamma chain